MDRAALWGSAMGQELWGWALGHPCPCSQNPLGARVREGQRVPLGPVLSDQMVLPDIAL